MISASLNNRIHFFVQIAERLLVTLEDLTATLAILNSNYKQFLYPNAKLRIAAERLELLRTVRLYTEGTP